MSRKAPLLTAGADEAVHLAASEEGDCPGFVCGYRFFWAGAKLEANPFEGGTKEALDYERGWRHGHAWSVADSMPH